jgi:hypothetical protein
VAELFQDLAQRSAVILLPLLIFSGAGVTS